MPNDHLRIMCPNLNCRLVLAVPQSARGKTVRCKGCTTSIRIPAAPPAKATEPPAEKKDKGAA
ncbi:MAG: hypothetical protein HEQ23_02940 [Tepidisphaera sp.]|jgi:hypothetical protein